MAFSINTNLNAFQIYDSVIKINAQTQKAQLNLATMKKINQVADDTSGYKVGTTLQGQNLVKKSAFNNGSSAKNYISTAEASLQLVNDKLNQITSKYQDSLDPLKSKASIAKDINSIADEIDSILKNTKINGSSLLANVDGSRLTGNAVFDVDGSITMDFASDSYLKVDDLNAILNGGTINDPGVNSYVGEVVDIPTTYTGSNQTSTITITFADGEINTLNLNLQNGDDVFDDIIVPLATNLFNNGVSASSSWNPSTPGNMSGNYGFIVSNQGSNIVSLETTSGFDVTTFLGMTRESSASTTGGLRSTDADTTLTAANDLSTVADNVKNALTRIGNLSQTIDSRMEYITSAIANNTALISNIFDADMAMEQLNATKGSIGAQVGLSMLSQVNASPQQLLSLFR